MKILVLKSKHANYYYRASDPQEIEASARKIMKSHLEMGFYNESWGNDPELENRVRAELDNPTGKAWGFIRGRSSEGHEYEHVAIENVL